ncbi:GntR family transcriptional regulator [Clostridiisalibacter paucivorans]|uniref:GntR family transcriptional regulator n=1 Tax=Clostridiisalibacter paucivorans TaxID=408753 RepID=UPI00047EBAE0|nr:GntR family transcriptional regulator [Clostridiisalibacter paucivorans]
MEKDLSKLDLQNYKPLREIVFQYLREAIIDGALKPGERLMEVQLGEKLGVSRTPVREAIRKLELEGLVVMEPRKGAYVADVSLNDLLNVLEIRSVLEGLAASLASKRITEQELAILKSKLYEFNESLARKNKKEIIEKDIELHDIIFKASRNKRLISLVDSLREQVHRFRIRYINRFNSSNRLGEEHRDIIEAISQGDSEKAKEYAEKHIKSAQEFILQQVDEKFKKNTTRSK